MQKIKFLIIMLLIVMAFSKNIMASAMPEGPSCKVKVKVLDQNIKSIVVKVIRDDWSCGSLKGNIYEISFVHGYDVNKQFIQNKELKVGLAGMSSMGAKGAIEWTMWFDKNGKYFGDSSDKPIIK